MKRKLEELTKTLPSPPPSPSRQQLSGYINLQSVDMDLDADQALMDGMELNVLLFIGYETWLLCPT